jgi:hypothetical protein
MSAHVLITGTLFRAPEQRTSKNGKPFVTATLKAKDGDPSTGGARLFAPTNAALGMRCTRVLAYSLDGACTNWAEEFFSRMRRAEQGHHHHIAGRLRESPPKTCSFSISRI